MLAADSEGSALRLRLKGRTMKAVVIGHIKSIAHGTSGSGDGVRVVSVQLEGNTSSLHSDESYVNIPRMELELMRSDGMGITLDHLVRITIEVDTK